MTIGGDWLRSFFCHGQSLLKEALGRGPVPCGTQQRVDQMALPIHGAIQVATLAFYLEIGFIDVPAFTDFSLTFPT
jgi:hypothetical protein